MASVLAGKHIHFSKIELVDGYWQKLVVELEARWNFAYVMPSAAREPIRLVIPRTLQMGWNKIPTYFCAMMETAPHVAQYLIDGDKHLSSTTPTMPEKCQSTKEPRQQMSAIYVDNYCLAAVEDAAGTPPPMNGKGHIAQNSQRVSNTQSHGYD
jgi:hypothetical protein